MVEQQPLLSQEAHFQIETSISHGSNDSADERTPSMSHDSFSTSLSADPEAHDFGNGPVTNEINHGRSNGATVFQTSLNMAKMCTGTGTLALPFAAAKGGLLFNFLGLFIIGLWNYYSANCLLRCLEYLPQIEQGEKGFGNNTNNSTGMEKLEQQPKYGTVDFTQETTTQIVNSMPPPPGTTTYGKVAWYAAGPKGLMVLDLLMMLLFFGLVIAYEVAMMSFIDATPLTTGSRHLDMLIPNTLVIILSSVPDISLLSKFSGIGLVAVALSFIIISLQGFAENGWSGFQGTSELKLWPESLSAASSWFGVVVFGYGVAPFVFTFRESMLNPQKVSLSLKIGLSMVYFSYIMISNGVMVLFSPSYTFDGDVLQAMPGTWISSLVRLLMTFVAAVTAPLLVVPCGELIEGKLGIENAHKRIMVRVIFCFVCIGVSLVCPTGFVHVVSFIGCFCVAMTSFVLPALFCIQLSTQNKSRMDVELLCDIGVLLFGIVAAFITSVMTFRELIARVG